jgi:hypothetical protein
MPDSSYKLVAEKMVRQRKNVSEFTIVVAYFFLSIYPAVFPVRAPLPLTFLISHKMYEEECCPCKET